MQYTNLAFLLTGGNLGDRQQNLNKALQLIEQSAGKVVGKSGIYETAAWGLTDQPAFLNQVLKVDTHLQANELLTTILQIEQQMGRMRLEKYGPRLIDIDILFYNNSVIKTDALIIPHPQIANRRFVLEPLNELAPQFTHPILKKSIAQLLVECSDNLPVSRLSSP